MSEVIAPGPFLKCHTNAAHRSGLVFGFLEFYQFTGLCAPSMSSAVVWGFRGTL